MLVREVISQRVWTFQIRVCFTNIYVIFVDATTRYLEPFQIIALLYESGLLLRVIRISVNVCIDVTIYDKLFYHLHNRENFLSPLVTKDNFDRCPVIHSWITLVPLD